MKGGFRSGAGRKVGALNKSTLVKKALAETIAKAAEMGIPEHIAAMGPLQVMARVMAIALNEGQNTLALSAASQLAPYVAPKLQHITNVTTTEPHKMSDNELQSLLAQLKSKAQEPDPIQPVKFLAAA